MSFPSDLADRDARKGGVERTAGESTEYAHFNTRSPLCTLSKPGDQGRRFTPPWSRRVDELVAWGAELIRKPGSWHSVGSIAIPAVLVISMLFAGVVPLTSGGRPMGPDPSRIQAASTTGTGCQLTPGSAAYEVGPITASFTLSPTLSLSGPGSVYVGVGVLGGTSTIAVHDSLGDTFTPITSYSSSWSDEGALFYEDYSAAESGLSIIVDFSGSTGTHAVAIAIPVVGTYQSPSLDAVGSWISATSATSITASVSTPNIGDTVLLFPFDTKGVSQEQGLTTPGGVFANIPNAAWSTYAELFEGSDAYGYDAGSGQISVTQGGGESGGDIFAVAIAIRPSSTVGNTGCPLIPGWASTSVGPISDSSSTTFELAAMDFGAGTAVYVGVGVLGGSSSIAVSDNLGNTFDSISSFASTWDDMGALFYQDYYAGEADLTVSVTFAQSTGTHAVVIAIPVPNTSQNPPSLDAIGPWVTATASTSITASVTTPRAGDTILMFPFDTLGIADEEGLPTPDDIGFGSVANGAASTYAELFEGNDIYGYDAGSGVISVTQGGGAPGGYMFAIAIALGSGETSGYLYPPYDAPYQSESGSQTGAPCAEDNNLVGPTAQTSTGYVYVDVGAWALACGSASILSQAGFYTGTFTTTLTGDYWLSVYWIGSGGAEVASSPCDYPDCGGYGAASGTATVWFNVQDLTDNGAWVLGSNFLGCSVYNNQQDNGGYWAWAGGFTCYYAAEADLTAGHVYQFVTFLAVGDSVGALCDECGATATGNFGNVQGGSPVDYGALFDASWLLVPYS